MVLRAREAQMGCWQFCIWYNHHKKIPIRDEWIRVSPKGKTNVRYNWYIGLAILIAFPNKMILFFLMCKTPNKRQSEASSHSPSLYQLKKNPCLLCERRDSSEILPGDFRERQNLSASPCDLCGCLLSLPAILRCACLCFANIMILAWAHICSAPIA